MAKQFRESTGQIEKRKTEEELKVRLQEFVDSKERWLMSEFRETWNKKNPEKIQELIKIQDRMICRFSKYSITVKINIMTI